MDSRVVLDEKGADKLLGNGDMLFLGAGTSMLLRGQGTYLGDDEINALTKACSTGEQNFVNELVNLKVKDDEDDSKDKSKVKKRDELYQDAINVVVREQRGSVSLLQRTLGIGYGRAARLIDYMEEDGIVGPYSGSKAREVLVTSVEVSDGDDTSLDAEEVVEEVEVATLDSKPPKPKLNALPKSREQTVASAPAIAEPEVEEEYEEYDEEEEWESEEEDEYEIVDEDDEEYEEEYEEEDEEYEDEDEVEASHDDDEYEYEEDEYEEYDEDEYEDVE